MTGGPSAWRRAAAVLALAVVLPALLPGQADAQETQNVQSDWSLIPSGVSVGQSFRLLFVTSTRRNAMSGNIADYNTFVQGRAAASTAISGVSGLSAKFRALISTSTVDARANTDTEGTDTDAIIYWLGGKKVADDYNDFYDGTWDNREGEGKTESGGSYTTDREIWTGSHDNGTKHTENTITSYANSVRVRTGDIIGASKSPISHNDRAWTDLRPLYALSPVITVVAETTAPTVTSGSTGYYGNAALTTALTGPQKSGADIYTKVTFSENMKHTKSNAAAARPELFHRIGTTDTQYDILDNGDTLASGDCKPNHASNTNVYVCRYTVGSSDTGAFAAKVGTNSVDKANNALASAYTHAATLTLDTTDPMIAFPSGVTPTVGTAATITLTDATAKVAKYGIVEVAGTATDATGCDDPSAGGDNFTTTAVDPVASPETVSHTPVTAGKKVCVYAEDAAGNSKSKLWTTAIEAASTTTVTPVPPNAIWSATLTVDYGSRFAGCGTASLGSLDVCTSSTALTEDEFTYGGTDYTVADLYRESPGATSGGGGLKLRLTGTSVTGSSAQTALAGLTLRAGSDTFSISSASVSGNYLTWSFSGTAWTDNQAITMSLTPPAPAKPAKPTGFSATAGDGNVALAWTNPSDSSITKYQYQQKAGNAAWGSWTNIASSAPGETNATSYTVTGLMNGTAYRFRIRAVNAAGNSPQSAVAGPVTPAAGTTTVIPVPPNAIWSATLTVGLVSAQSYGCSSIGATAPCSTSTVLTDDDFVHESTTYTIQALRTFSGKLELFISGYSFATAKAALSGLTLNVGTSSFAIDDASASNGGLGWSNPPSWSTGDTVSLSLTPPADNTRPAKPTTFTAAPGNTQVVLSWTIPTDATITKWQYRQKTTGSYGSWQNIASSDKDTVTHTVTGLMNGTQYTFQVRAHDAGGAGATSDAASATPAATVPDGVTYTADPSGWFKKNDTVGFRITVTVPQSAVNLQPLVALILRTGAAGCTGSLATWGSSSISPNVATAGQHTFDINVGLTSNLVGTGSDKFCASVVDSNLDWEKKFPLAGFKVDHTKPTVEFPAATTVPTEGQSYTLSLGDAHSKLKKYGAIAVDGSTGAAADCDTAAEVGSTNLTTEATAQTSKSFVWTVPASSAGKKVCVYAEDAAGNIHSALGGTAIVSPPPAPTVSSVELTSLVADGQNGHYKIGDTVAATVTFSAAVNVTGPPRLELQVGSNARQAAYAGGSGSALLTFNYRVREGDADSDGIAIGANKLTLNGGTIKETTGVTDANRNFGAVTANSAHKVDGVRPTVTAASTGYYGNAALSTALTGPQKSGDIYTKVTFSEDMKHTKSDTTSARPELFHRIGTTDTQYDILDNGDTLASGDCKPNHASDTNVYVCLYTVGSSDSGAFAAKVGTNSVDQADNALASAYTHAATLTLDTTDPMITFPSVTPSVGTALTISLEDTGSKLAKYGIVEVAGTATDATGCDDPSAGGDNFTTTAVSPLAARKLVSHTPVTAGKKVCVYAEDAAGNSASALWTTAITTPATVGVTGVTVTPDPAFPRTKLIVRWTAKSGAASYQVRWTNEANKDELQDLGLASTAPVASNVLEYTVTTRFDPDVDPQPPLTAGTTIYVKVMPLPAGFVLASTRRTLLGQATSVQGTTLGTLKPVVTAALAGDDVTLTWPSVAIHTDIASFQYRQEADSGSWSAWSAIPNSDKDTVTHTVSGLTGGTAYRFQVQAHSSAGAVGEASEPTPAVTPPDTTDPTIAFPSGVTPRAGTAATITLEDAGSKLAKYGIVEVAGTATDATGCDDPSAGGDNFTTTAVSPLASSENVSYTPVTAGKKVCVYAEDAAGNSASALWATAIAAAGTTTVIPVPPNAIWSATLTVGTATGTSTGCSNDGSASRCDSSTVLTDDDFEYPSGTTYTVHQLYLNNDGTSIFLDFSLISDTAAKAALSGLRLNVGTSSFAIADAVASGDGLQWSNPPSWSTGDTVSLSLTPADTTAPKITGIAVTSTPNRGGTYTAGETIEFTVTFDEKVNVVESFAPSGPILQYLLGSGEANARYKRGSGTTEVVFGTDLVLGRLSTLVDTDGISIVANPPILAVAGASIRDTANNDADLSYAGLAAQSGHKVDNKPPLAPTGLTATPGDRRVTLGWSAPTPADTSIASWQYQQRVGTGAWGAWTDVPGSRAATRSHMLRLLGDLAYGFRVRAQDAANDGAASAEATATPTGGSLDRLTPPRGQTVEAGGPLVPKGSGGSDLVAAGAKFRLLFVTSTTRNATSANIADYNSFVQARAGAASTANAAIKSFSSQFRALISTATAHARDNTATTGAGEPIHWLGGAKVADDYNDFYDGSWDSGPGKTELGQSYATSVWTGSKANGTTDAAYPAGASRVRMGSASQGQPTIALGDIPISGHAPAWETQGLLALSPVLTVVDGARPAKPAGLSGSRGVREVTLSWTAPMPADGSIVRYEYRQKSGTGAYGAWTAIAGSGAGTTSHTVGNLAKGIYTFQVRAVDSVGAGAASDAVEQSPSDRPTGLGAVADIASVTLTWDDPEDPTITGYQVKRGSGSWTDIEGSGAGTVSHTVRKLSGTEHAFRVRAVYAVGESDESDEVRATPSWARSGTPDFPTGLTAAPGDGRATLSWDNLRRADITDVGFIAPAVWQVRYAAGGAWGAWRAVELSGGMATHFRAARVGVTLTGLTNDKVHRFQVRAVSESKVAGPASDAATATPSRSIPALAVTPGTDRLEVSWAGAAVPGAFGYGVEVRSGSDRNVLFVLGGAASITLENLTPGTVYVVKVSYQSGYNDNGRLLGEVRVSTLGATGAPGQVTGMRVHNRVGNSGLEAVWAPVLGADGYKVQWKSGNEEYAATRETAVAGEAASSHIVGELVPGREYTVRVLATRAGAPDGAPSAEASARVRGAWITSGNGELTVHWALEPNPNVWGYEVDYRTALAENHRSYYHNVVAVRGDSWTLKYLMPDQEYVVRVGYLFDITGHEQFIAEVRGTPSGAAELMPQMSAASVRGDVMRIGYDASLDGDSTPPAGSYSVRAGASQRAVADVSVRGQTVTLRLARPVGAGAAVTVDYHPPSGDGAIRSAAGHAAPGFSGQSVENGTPAALSVADARAAEGASLAFAVTLDRAVSVPVTVAWATADGTATAGADYEAASGTLTFAAGETEKTVSVALLEDTAADDAETLTLTLSNPTGATLADAEATGTVTDTAPALPPLTASIAEAPSEHGGKGKAFAVRIAFSAPLADGAGKALRNGALVVEGGAVKRVQRVDGRRDLWSVRIQPAGHGAVTLRLTASGDCGSPGSVCTADGRALTNALTATVAGPVTLSVADARAKEGVDESIAFAVTLSRAASDEVTVRYVTRNGTAKAGEDYRRAKGKLTFAAGETAKTIAVALLDDARDEGEETFRLVLSKARGAVIADGEAVGTIENSDPLQQAWLARFGRTVATQAVDAVTARLEGLAPGAHATLAGQALDLSRADDAEALAEAMTGLARAFGAPAAPEGGNDPFAHGSDGTGVASSGARSMSGRELLLGSSFHLATGDEAGGPGFAAWGRAAHGSFEGEAGDVTLDGNVTTGFLGADVSGRGWLAGAALAHSQGEGTFALASGMDSTRDRGTVESTLTSVLPYARVDLSERVSAWGLAGWGTGTLTLTETGETETNRYRADLSMTMGAVGGRGTLVPAPEGGGFALALGSDAFWVRTESESVPGMTGAKADATRLRLTLDASRPFALTGGGTLTPSLEVGLRHDGGDAETGAGVELGAGLGFSDPGSGVSAELRTRWLAAHESGSYEEWGVSGSVRIDPGARGRGLSLTLAPTVGNASSGTGALWSAADARGLAPGTEFEAGRRFEARLGYGFAAFGDRFTATPELGVGLSNTGRDYRLGWRLTSALEGDPGFEVGLDAMRRETANGNEAPEHGVMLRGAIRW